MCRDREARNPNGSVDVRPHQTRRVPVTGGIRTWATVGVLLGVLTGCGTADDRDEPTIGPADEADADGDDTQEGAEVGEVTEQPAEDVDLTVVLERTVVGGDPAVRVLAQVTNRRDVDVAVVSPALGGFTDGEDGTVLVRADASELEDAPIGDAVEDGTDDAPPTVPAVVVAAGGTADLDVAVTAIPDQPPAVEVCLEVQPLATGGVTGDEVSLTDTAPDGVRELACGRAAVPGR
jgi:hypothetical protein